MEVGTHRFLRWVHCGLAICGKQSPSPRFEPRQLHWRGISAKDLTLERAEPANGSACIFALRLRQLARTVRENSSRWTICLRPHLFCVYTHERTRYPHVVTAYRETPLSAHCSVDSCWLRHARAGSRLAIV